MIFFKKTMKREEWMSEMSKQNKGNNIKLTYRKLCEVTTPEFPVKAAVMIMVAYVVESGIRPEKVNENVYLVLLIALILLQLSWILRLWIERKNVNDE